MSNNNNNNNNATLVLPCLQFSDRCPFKDSSAHSDAFYISFTEVPSQAQRRKASEISKNPFRFNLSMKKLVHTLKPYEGKWTVSVYIPKEIKQKIEAISQVVIHHLFEERKKLFTGYPDLENCNRSKEFAAKFFTSIVKENSFTGESYVSPKIDEYTEVVDKDNLPLDYNSMKEVEVRKEKKLVPENPICAGSTIGFMKLTVGRVNFNPSLDNRQKLSITIRANFVRFREIQETSVVEYSEEERASLYPEETPKDDNGDLTPPVQKRFKAEAIIGKPSVGWCGTTGAEQEEGEIIDDESTQQPMDTTFDDPPSPQEDLSSFPVDTLPRFTLPVRNKKKSPPPSSGN